jgi:hypothetical protein
MLILLFAPPPPSGAQLYAVIYPSALSAPSAAQVKAGQNSGGGAAVWSGTTASPTSTGTFDWPSTATGLTSGTSYRVAFVWSNGTFDSNVAVSSPWVTLSNSYSLALDADTYSLTGNPVTFRTTLSIPLDTGVYTLNGQPVTLTWSGVPPVATPIDTIITLRSLTERWRM